MLNLLPSIVKPSTYLPSRSAEARRRGGQPYNHNALHHGFYAVKNRTPLTRFFSSNEIHHIISVADRSVFDQAIQDLHGVMLLAYQSLEEPENTHLVVENINLMVKALNIIVKLRTFRSIRLRPFQDLQFISQNANALVQFDFRHHDITRDADSFRGKIENSDFNSLGFEESLCGFLSKPPYPFISSRQWRILEPLLPPPDRHSPRGRPSVDRRPLLDAIFWKFAHHARWQDLPVNYPPMLTCRRYYRRLFRSGRLATLYSALFDDFHTHAKADFIAFVNKGCFWIMGNRVIFRLDQPESWQTRTALLFIQKGLQVVRDYRREKVQERRQKFPTIQAFLKRQQAMHAPLAGLDPESSFSPIDLNNIGSANIKGRKALLYRSQFKVTVSSHTEITCSSKVSFQDIRSANSTKKVTLIPNLEYEQQNLAAIDSGSLRLSFHHGT